MKLSSIWSNGMILQRNKEIHITGLSENAKVIIHFAGQTYETIVNQDKSWEIILPPFKEGGPYDMLISDAMDRTDHRKKSYNAGISDNVEITYNLEKIYDPENIDDTKKTDDTKQLGVMETSSKNMETSFKNMETWDESTIYITDILFGDVWILGGQSNMELPVSRVMDSLAEEVEGARDNYIRMFKVPQHYNFNKSEEFFYEGSWVNVNPESVMEFSAVGYFFARELRKYNNVPIGLIHTAVGGTPVEAWMSEETLKQFGTYEEELKKNKDNEYVDARIKSDAIEQEQWFSLLSKIDEGLHNGSEWYLETCMDEDWNTMELPKRWYGTELENVRGSVWFRKDFEVPKDWLDKDIKLALGTLVDGDDTYVNGVHVGNTGYQYPPRRYLIPKGVLHQGKNNITVRIFSNANVGGFIPDKPYYLSCNSEKVELSGVWKYRIGGVTDNLKPQTFFQYMPTGLYRGMIYPLKNISITGVAFYQGESNTGHPENYETLFKKMILDWRRLFGQEDLPFLYVQLSNFGDGKKKNSGTNWAMLREAQRRVLSLSNVAMVVSLDVGEYNDLHPQNKKEIGIRLSYAARHIAYGEELVFSGPIVKEANIEQDSGGKRVRISFEHIGSGLISKHGPLKQLSMIDQDDNVLEAFGYIEDNTIVIPLKEEQNPKKLRYAWENHPDGANLYNKEGFPASSFEFLL